MSEQLKYYIELCAFVIIGLTLVGFVVLIISGKMDSNDINIKKNGFSGNVEIVQIETFQETHDYLYYNEGHRGSVEHLPNCRFCKEINKD